MGGWVAIVWDRKSQIALFDFEIACMHDATARSTARACSCTVPVRVWQIYVHRHALTGMQLICRAGRESRLVGTGFLRGFQDDITLSGMAARPFRNFKGSFFAKCIFN